MYVQGNKSDLAPMYFSQQHTEQMRKKTSPFCPKTAWNKKNKNNSCRKPLCVNTQTQNCAKILKTSVF